MQKTVFEHEPALFIKKIIYNYYNSATNGFKTKCVWSFFFDTKIKFLCDSYLVH